MKYVCPRVSIIIPVYNGANYMRQAIDSALAQDYKNLEILVVNDGSTDGGETARIGESYGDRIRFLEKENGGVASALNLAIREMTGEYISWLSHDDVYAPQKISAQIRLLAKNEDKTAVFSCGTRTIDATGKTVGMHHPLDFYPKKRLEHPLFALLHGSVSGCTLLIHKSHMERVGQFREDLRYTQDYELWFRLLRGQPLRFARGMLVSTRVHREQDSKSAKQQYLNECDALWIMMMKTLSPEEKLAMCGSEYGFYRDMGFFLLRNSEYGGAIVYAEQEALQSLETETRSGTISLCVQERRQKRDKKTRTRLLRDRELAATQRRNLERLWLSLRSEGVRIACMRAMRAVQCRVSGD